ncbi:C45 family autoproteolytic acyltransferase/hydolase [Paenibacillus zanthoxyli]|uniref:C45 family autoproteolytic acyltransferase/hydolase n=1 Tax=Paenibacillus zanthoxyli TaxID=369399 RepID=UPI00046F7769|nr:C45 family peptidase [Paenibacillus zanthoxyli]
MKKLVLQGTPREIGVQHGQQGKEEVLLSLELYERLFYEQARISWADARQTAKLFLPAIESGYADFMEEMAGVAYGAGVDFEDILTLHARSEIALTQGAVGEVEDGCSSIAILPPVSRHTILAQNWDFYGFFKRHLLFLHIERHGKPAIDMVTEAGMIGKIGMNACGVGVCLNALRAREAHPGKLPVHLGLRAVLDSPDIEHALAEVGGNQLATAANFLMAESHWETGAKRAVNLEASPAGSSRIESTDGAIPHTNHFLSNDLIEKIGKDNLIIPEHSYSRLATMKEYLASVKERSAGERLDETAIRELLSDHTCYPDSICRHTDDPLHMSVTQFAVIMNLDKRTMKVAEGTPCSVLFELMNPNMSKQRS